MELASFNKGLERQQSKAMRFHYPRSNFREA